MNRTLSRSLVCSSLALAMGLAPVSSALAASITLAPEAEGSVEASAAPDGDPEALSAKAVEHFQAKEYDAAVDLFQQAYDVDPQPNYLFNIGRVYEEKGDLENAVVFYQRFVGQSGVDLESRQTATERLKVLRETLDQLKQEEDGDGDEKPTEDIVEDPPPDTSADEEQAAKDKRKKIMRITGYSLLGAGGGLVIVGAVFGGMARGSADDADADEFVDRKLAFRNQARDQARTADALFITGGIVAAAGLVLVLSTVGGKKKVEAGDATARRTTWSPVVSRTQFGLGMTHRF